MPISLQVRPTFQWPAVYLNGTSEEVEEALQLGAQVQTLVHLQKSTEDVRRAVEKQDAIWSAKLAEETQRRQVAQQAAQQATTEAQASRSTLETLRQQTETAKVEARRQEREVILLETEERLRKAQQAVDAATERLAIAEERCATLTQTRDHEIAVAVQRTRDLMSQVTAVREEQAAAAQGALKTLQEAYNRQADEIRSLSDFLRRRVSNAKTKGNDYETDFRDILLRAYGSAESFQIDDTNRNGVGHAGDFRTRFGSDWVLWEVKNYDRPVPRAECDKFQRDMLENRNIRVGVMVSRGTEITGKTGSGDRCVEFLEGRLLIYFSRFEAMGDEIQTLQTLLPLFRVWWRLTDGDEEEQTAHVEETIRSLELVVGNLVKRRQEWRVHRSRMDEILRWMTESVEEAEEQVQAVLKRIQGTTVGNQEVPEGIFRPNTMDEKIRATIATLLEDYEFREGGEVRLADMADTFAGRRKISKDSARKYILAAVLDTAVHSAAGKPTLIRGLCPKRTHAA